MPIPRSCPLRPPRRLYPLTALLALACVGLTPAACSLVSPGASSTEGAKGSGGAGGASGGQAGGARGGGSGGSSEGAGGSSGGGGSRENAGGSGSSAAGGASAGAGGNPEPADAAPPTGNPETDGASPSPDAGAAPDGAAAGSRTPGCTAGETLPEGEATIDVQGRQRRYRLRLPQGYSREKAWPLVLALHPNGGSGIGYWDGEGGARPLRQILRDNAVLVLPLALPRGGGFDWRDNLPTELAYFEALMARLKANLCIDESRIFSMGFSGGGSFSGVLGCHRKDIRAIAVGGAVTYFDREDCVGTPAAWVNISSGDQSAGRSAFRDYWRTRNQCSDESKATPPTGCVAYTCPPGKPVHYCTQEGGHAWPGYGTQAAWTFFSQF